MIDTLMIVSRPEHVTITLTTGVAWFVGIFTIAGAAWAVLGLHWMAQDGMAAVRRWL